MKVAALKGTGIADRLIQLWTWSKYSHCELVFSDGVTFGSTLKPPMKTSFSQKVYNPALWDLIDINVPPEKEALIRMFCEKQAGKEYDWKAIFLSQILFLRKEDPDKWICSEVCVAAFQKASYCAGLKPCTVSPGKFVKLAKAI